MGGAVQHGCLEFGGVVLRARARPGVRISAAICTVVDVARAFGCAVELDYNGDLVRVEPDDDPREVHRRWRLPEEEG